MNKKDNKKSRNRFFYIACTVFLICIIGISYAFFEYFREGKSYEIITGDIYLLLNDDTDSLQLINLFPMSKEEARADEENMFSFSITSKNTTLDKNLYYDVMLNEGNEIAGKTRIDPEYLLFDLYQVIDGEDVRIVDAMSFDSLDETKIWANTIYSETNDEVNITYKLRMWLSDNILISDTDVNADYTTEEFENSYANVKISVSGDFNERRVPYNYMKRFGDTVDLNLGTLGSFWPEEMANSLPYISTVRFISIDRNLINLLYEQGGCIDLTDTTKSAPGSVIAAPLETENGVELMIMSDGITYLPEDCSGMFWMASDLKNISFGNINCKYVRNMIAMFFGCGSLTNLDLSNWDVSSVTNMSYMFAGCGSLTSLDLSNWDVSSVTNMSYMFSSCSSLTSLDLSNWDVSNVTNMSYMFNECNRLTSLDLSNWDVSSVTAMDYMFYSCSSLTSLDLGNWDVSSVTDMGYMFYNCSSLTSLDLSNWDVSSVTTMNNMFNNCSNLTSLDLSNWDVSAVTIMLDMFSSCSNLTSLDLSNWDVSNVTDMRYMFYNCSSLTSLDLSNWDVSNVNTMNQMFCYCSNLTTIYANNNWEELVTNLADGSFMFTGCSKLVGKVAYDSLKRDITMANLDGYFTKKEA